MLKFERTKFKMELTSLGLQCKKECLSSNKLYCFCKGYYL